MKMIVVADENWGIGAKGDLLTSLPEDMKFFRETTKGNAMIMGRKTLESFPEKKPLKDRVHIIITRTPDFRAEGCEVVSNIYDAIKVYKEKYNQLDCFVVGGGSVYRQLLPYCDTAYITKIHKAFDYAEVFIDNLDKLDNWEVTEESELKKHEDIEFKFVTYKNNAVRTIDKDKMQYEFCEGHWNK